MEQWGLGTLSAENRLGGNGLALRFFLSDFENVQIKNIGHLTPGACQIKIFLGKNQSKLLLELVQALQPFGTDAEYIQIAGNGPNALDFHIAFYIGRLAMQHPDASFTIISKDGGFDPLIKHLASLKIRCERIASLPGAPKTNVAPKAATPAPKAAVVPQAKSTPAKNVVVTFLPEPNTAPVAGKASVTTAARVAEAVARLKGMKSARPARLATLESSIKSWFKPALQSNEVGPVIHGLLCSKKIKVEGTKVTYHLAEVSEKAAAVVEQGALLAVDGPRLEEEPA